MARDNLKQRAETAISVINASLPPLVRVKALQLVPDACWHVHPLDDPELADGLFPLHPHLVLLLPEHPRGASYLGLPVHPGTLPKAAAIYMQRQLQRLAWMLSDSTRRKVTLHDIDSAYGVTLLMQKKAETAVFLAEGVIRAAENVALAMLGTRRMLRHERLLAAPYKRAMGYATGLSECVRFSGT